MFQVKRNQLNTIQIPVDDLNVPESGVMIGVFTHLSSGYQAFAVLADSATKTDWRILNFTETTPANGEVSEVTLPHNGTYSFHIYHAPNYTDNRDLFTTLLYSEDLWLE